MLKRDWTVIDAHATKATMSIGKTFSDLVSFLDEPIKNLPDRDIYMTRGLLQWMRRAETFTYKADPPKASPNQLAKDMFDTNQRVAFADGYQELCSSAGVQCEVVTGISKSGKYEPGHIQVERNDMHARWNKVFLLGNWWPINARWVLRAAPKDRKSSTDMMSDFNDFWFLTDPAVFVQKCYPDDADDQMLVEARRVQTQRSFMTLPYLTQAFFTKNLRMTSEEQCIVEAIEGQCRISFKFDNDTTGTDSKRNAMFCCQVSDKDVRVTQLNNNQPLKVKDIRQLVFCSRKKNHFMFDIRCPVIGAYHLTIRGSHLGNPKPKLLTKVKVICREPMKDFLPFPVDTGEIGWGFGPHARKAGLTKTNKTEPKIAIDHAQLDSDMQITFDLDKKHARRFDYQAHIYVNGKCSDDLKEYIDLTREERTMTIAVDVPTGGEYALVVSASADQDRDRRTYRPVCQYLLTVHGQQDEEEYYDSSDGTSDVDDEISQLGDTLSELNDERDKLRAELVSRQSMRGQGHHVPRRY